MEPIPALPAAPTTAPTTAPVPVKGTIRIVRPRGRAAALRLRVVGPADTEPVGQFLRALSPEARYRRFHAGVAGVSDRVVGRLLQATPPYRQAVVLEHGRGAAQTVLGLAQLAKENDTTAEIALVIADDWQRCGLGGELLTTLTQLAAGHYRTLSAYVQPDNTPALGLLRAAADGLVAEYQGPVVRLTWPARPAAIRREAAA